MIHPNPEIYREAAQLLADRGAGFSCNAILAVCDKHKLSWSNINLYRTQYLAALGMRPAVGVKLHTEGDVWWINKGYVPGNHPFWNRSPDNPEMHRRRILALLLMAELVANP